MTMHKTVKLMAIIIAAVSVFGIAGIFKSLSPVNRQLKPDTVAVNDLVMTLLEEDKITAEQMSDRILLLYRQMEDGQQTKDNTLKLSLCALIILAGMASVIMLIYVDRRVLQPFIRMKQFAGKIAAGNLDEPLNMDKGGGFGAYTESLDLMRSELKRAREAEIEAVRSKKELVASLSHDVKTPVASIKAVAELMEATCTDPRQLPSLRTIVDKTDQINRLVGGMFKATLEELQELEVKPSEITSTEIENIIRSADYAGKAVIGPLTDCVVTADAHRLAQVFDNIISNSYKYAGTVIRIESAIEKKRLILRFTDAGGGAPEDDLPLLTQKFYRGGNSQGKDGAGLGLYISRYLVERMGGLLTVDNSEDGFLVQIILKLA